MLGCWWMRWMFGEEERVGEEDRRVRRGFGGL